MAFPVITELVASFTQKYLKLLNVGVVVLVHCGISSGLIVIVVMPVFVEEEIKVSSKIAV